MLSVSDTKGQLLGEKMTHLLISFCPFSFDFRLFRAVTADDTASLSSLIGHCSASDGGPGKTSAGLLPWSQHPEAQRSGEQSALCTL